VVDTWGYTDSAPVGGTRTTVAPFSWFGVPNGSTVYAAVAGDEILASADGGTLWTRHYAPGS
jgi:hypothetical protein